METKLTLIQQLDAINLIDRKIRDIRVFSTDTVLSILESLSLPEHYLVYLNGRLVNDVEEELGENSVLLILPVMAGGGGGKSATQILATVSIIVASAYAGPAVGLWLNSSLGLGLGAMSYTALGMGLVNLAGGMLLTYLTRPKVNNSITDTDLDNTSNSYSFNPQTTQTPGLPIPVVYGKFAIPGNIIYGDLHKYQDGTDVRAKMSILVGLSEGQIESVDSVKINSVLAENYDNCTVTNRFGLLNQPSIPGFNQVKTTIAPLANILLDNPVYYEIPGNADEYRITVEAPQGIYLLRSSDGTKLPIKIDVNIELWKDGALITDGVLLSFETNGSYPLIQTATIQGNFSESGYTLKATMMRKYYQTTTTVQKPYQYELYNSDTNEWELHTVYRNVTTTGWEPYTGVGENDYAAILEDVILTLVEKVVYQDLQYPKLAYTGIQVVADEEISGGLDILVTLKGKKIVQYSTVDSWFIGWTDNPAWVAFDILTRPVYSDDLSTIYRYDGINPSRIDIQSFIEWAEYCDELVLANGIQQKRATFNGVFEATTSLWEAVLKVADISRANLIWSAFNLKAILDKPSDPVQFFNMGNILAGSFSETYLSLDDRASEVAVTYMDADDGFNKHTINIADDDLLDTSNKVSITADGCTNLEYAYRIGKFHLYNNNLLVRFISFRASLDALSATVGDVIHFQHDLPEWGDGGRILEDSTLTSIKLDKTIEFGNYTYQVLLRNEHDEIVSKIINQRNTTTDTITFSVPLTETLPKYTLYSVGKLNSSIKPFRITKIAKYDDLTFTIDAIEYNESIYLVDSDQTPLPTINYSALNIYPTVSNVVAVEKVYTIKGQLTYDLEVTFDRSEDTVSCNIYSGSGSYKTFLGNTTTAKFVLPRVTQGNTYHIGVEPINSYGVKGKIVYNRAYVTGDMPIPIAVNSFHAVQSGQFIKFSWNKVTNTFIAYYTIRENGKPIAQVTENFYSIPVGTFGDRTFTIEAVNFSGDIGPTTSVNITTVFMYTTPGEDGTYYIPGFVSPISQHAPVTSINTVSGVKSIVLNLTYIPEPYFYCVEIWGSRTNDIYTSEFLGTTSTYTFTHTNLNLVDTWYYWARIRDNNGACSDWYPTFDAGVTGTTLYVAPNNVVSIDTTPGIYGIIVDVKFTRTDDFAEVELFMSNINDFTTALKIDGNLSGSFVIPIKEIGAYRFFWARVRDTFNQYSDFYPQGLFGIEGHTSTDATDLLDYLEGQITAETLGLELQASIADSTTLYDETIHLIETVVGDIFAVPGVFEHDAIVCSSQDVKDLDGRVSNAYIDIDTANGRIDAVTYTVDGINDRLGTAEININSLNTEILERVTLTDYNLGLAGLSETLTTAYIDADALINAELQDTVAIVNDNTSQIASVITNLSATQTSLDAVSASLTETISAVNTNTGQLATATTNITTLQSDVSRLSSSLTNTVSVVNTHTSQIASVSSGLSATQSDVGYLEAQAFVTVGAGNKIAGYKIGVNSSSSVFDILVNNFRISKSDGSGSQTMFAVGTVNGSTQVGVRGDLLVDNSVTANKVVTSGLITQTLQIGADLITVPKYAEGYVSSVAVASVYNEPTDAFSSSEGTLVCSIYVAAPPSGVTQRNLIVVSGRTGLVGFTAVAGKMIGVFAGSTLLRHTGWYPQDVDPVVVSYLHETSSAQTYYVRVKKGSTSTGTLSANLSVSVMGAKR